jgi:hypothetical protein
MFITPKHTLSTGAGSVAQCMHEALGWILRTPLPIPLQKNPKENKSKYSFSTQKFLFLSCSPLSHI